MSRTIFFAFLICSLISLISCDFYPEAARREAAQRKWAEDSEPAERVRPDARERTREAASDRERALEPAPASPPAVPPQPSNYQEAARSRPISSNVLYYVQTTITLDNLRDYPLPEKHCEITRINFTAAGIPMTVSSVENSMYVETEVRDVVAFRQYASDALSWWKISSGKIEDLGSRLSMKVATRQKYDFAMLRQAMFDYYGRYFDDVSATVTCGNLPEWIVTEYPVEWERVIREAPIREDLAPPEPTARPGKRRPR